MSYYLGEPIKIVQWDEREDTREIIKEYYTTMASGGSHLFVKNKASTHFDQLKKGEHIILSHFPIYRTIIDEDEVKRYTYLGWIQEV